MRKSRLGAVVIVTATGIGGAALFTGCGGRAGLCSPCTLGTVFTVGQLARVLLSSQPGDSSGRIAVSCWDLNANGKADAQEDRNQDGVVDVLDCQGPPGEASQPIPGTNGLACWDLNGDGVQDPNEDLNSDGLWTALDCRGPAGPPGSSGGSGPAGPQGPQGQPGPQLFDLFVNDFIIPDYYDGYERPYSLNFENGYGYLYAIPTGLPVLEGDDGVAAFAVPVPEYYNPGYPVTLRLFLTAYIEDCAVLQLNGIRGIPGVGIVPYGQTRWIKLDLPEHAPPASAPAENGYDFGHYLVIDLPVQAGAPNGLALPDDLETRQILAFEIRAYELDGSILLGGVEFFESLPGQAGSVIGATIYYEEDFEGWPESICRLCRIQTDDPNVIRDQYGCPWLCEEDTDCPNGEENAYCTALSDHPEINACHYEIVD
ncbi:MAG: hypothetical protein ACUVXJ_17405 [Phycisphaerae bacterium]